MISSPYCSTNRGPAILAALLLSVAVIPIGCSQSDERPGASSTPSRSKRVLLVGVDGAEWGVIDPLVEQGRLPAFARFRQEGASGPLESLPIMLSPIIWTTIATGMDADKHGIGWFMAENPKTGKRIPIQSRHRRVKAIWNILGEAGLSAGVIGWWATWPAEEIGPGFIVTDYLGFHGFGNTGRNRNIRDFLTYPDGLLDAVGPMMPETESVTFEEVRRYLDITEEEYREAMALLDAVNAKEGFRNMVTHFVRYLATMRGYEEIGLRLWKERQPDLMAIYFEQVDSAGHLFMKYAPPRQDYVDAQNYDKYRRVVEEIYVRQDQILGRYLEAAGPDTTVVLVSDHGFKTGDERPAGMADVDHIKAAQEHRRYGVITALGPGIRPGARIEGARVQDVTPTLLYLLGEPVARDMDGRVLTGMISEEFLASRPPVMVESYQSAVASGSEPEPIDVAQEMSSAEEERLRALGYLSDEPDASSAEVHNNLAMLLMQKEELDGAIAEYRKALRLDPGDASAHAGLATVFAQQGRIDRAREEFDVAQRLDPKNRMTLTCLGHLELELGRIDEARAAFRRALGTDETFLPAILGLGASFARVRDWDEARRRYESALAHHPDSPILHYNLARVLVELGATDQAIERSRRTLELAPEFWSAYNNLGDLYHSLGRLDEAAEALEAVVRGNPDHVPARYNLATVLMSLGSTEQQRVQAKLRAAQEALRRTKASRDASSERTAGIEQEIERQKRRLETLAAAKEENLERAIALFEEVIARSPDFEFAHNNLALAHGYRGDTLGAFRAYDRMTGLFPRNPMPWLQTAYFQMTGGNTEDATRRLRQAFVTGRQAVLARARQMPIFRSLDLDALYEEATGSR